MPYFLSIDQSTSATKALLFDEQLELVDKVSLEHQQRYPNPGWVEHDAEEIWSNTKASVRELISRRSEEGASIACLSITNQRETIVIFEKGSGKPLYPAMVWQCRRGAEICREIDSRGYGSRVERKTGLKVDAYFSASKLKWLMHERPDIAGRLADGSALVGTIDAYLVYRMTGGSHFATDTTNASRTLLFDIETLEWDDELCALWDVPLHSLPEVRDSSSVFGETDLEGILPKSLPICGVIGDSQAALFAQSCFEAGQAKVTFGTGSSLLLTTGNERQIPGNGIVETLAWTIKGRPTYAYEGIIISSGATLAWLRDQLGVFQDYGEVEGMARGVEDNGGVYLVPAFTGMGLPYWDSDARAALVGMSNQCDRRHVVRAGLESIALQVSAALEAMMSEAGTPLQTLRADGGATENQFLMQLVADLCGTELEVSEMPECSALGAVMSGLVGIGIIDDLSGLATFKRDTTRYAFQRERSSEIEALRTGWNTAVDQIIGWRPKGTLEPVS